MTGAPAEEVHAGPWTPARLRLWGAAAIVAAWLPLLGVPARGWLDLAAFWTAGRLAGSPELTSLAAVATFQAANGLPPTPFVYPPGIALLYAPLAALPYAAAGIVHVLLMAGALVAAAVLGAPLVGLPRRLLILAALAWAPAAASVASGQNATLALLLAVLSLRALAGGRPILAGILAGLLGYKPQLGAPLAGLALLRGWGRVLAAVALAGGVHYLAGVLATGGDLAWPAAWLAAIRGYSGADMAANGWQAIGLPAIGARLALVTGFAPLALAGWAAGIALLVAVLPALRRLPPVEAGALALAVGVAVSPHAWVYDATLLLPALAVLAARAARAGWPPAARTRVVLAWGLALAWPIGGVVGLTPLPLVVVLVPLLLARGEPGAQAGTAASAPSVSSRAK